MADPIENGAVRTETEKGTNVGDYDSAVRTEAEKEAGGPPAATVIIFRRRIEGD